MRYERRVRRIDTYGNKKLEIMSTGKNCCFIGQGKATYLKMVFFVRVSAVLVPFHEKGLAEPMLWLFKDGRDWLEPEYLV